MLNSEELINKVKVYNKFLNPEKLNKAYNFAVKAHENQKRDSDRKSTRLNSSHSQQSRMPSSA